MIWFNDVVVLSEAKLGQKAVKPLIHIMLIYKVNEVFGKNWGHFFNFLILNFGYLRDNLLLLCNNLYDFDVWDHQVFKIDNSTSVIVQELDMVDVEFYIEVFVEDLVYFEPIHSNFHEPWKALFAKFDLMDLHLLIVQLFKETFFYKILLEGVKAQSINLRVVKDFRVK